MSMRSIYTRAVRKELSGYFGNWEPGAPVQLGDYGFLVGNVFERVGLISTFGVSWKTRTSGQALSNRKFASSKSVTTALKAAGRAPTAKAALTVDFAAGSAVFADFAGCIHHLIDDKRALGEFLLAAPGFDLRWVVVTDVITSRRSIVAISSNAKASVTFEAKASVRTIDLSDGSVELKASAQRSIGYLIDAEQDLTPLIGLCGFRSRFLSLGSELRALSYSDGQAIDTEASAPLFLQLL